MCVCVYGGEGVQKTRAGGSIVVVHLPAVPLATHAGAGIHLPGAHNARCHRSKTEKASPSAVPLW